MWSGYRIVVGELSAQLVDDRPLTYPIDLLSLPRGPIAPCASEDDRSRDSITTARPQPVTGSARRSCRARSLLRVQCRTRPPEHLGAESRADRGRPQYIGPGPVRLRCRCAPDSDLAIIETHRTAPAGSAGRRDDHLKRPCVVQMSSKRADGTPDYHDHDRADHVVPEKRDVAGPG